MYKERLNGVIKELEDIAAQIRGGGIDSNTLHGTNLNPTNCIDAAESLDEACFLVMQFIDDNFTE